MKGKKTLLSPLLQFSNKGKYFLYPRSKTPLVPIQFKTPIHFPVFKESKSKECYSLVTKSTGFEIRKIWAGKLGSIIYSQDL
jgi:hypothetical protein